MKIILKEGQKVIGEDGNTYLVERGDNIMSEASEKEFKSYSAFRKYAKSENLKWNDVGPFIIEDIEYKTVGDVFESFEE